MAETIAPRDLTRTGGGSNWTEYSYTAPDGRIFSIHGHRWAGGTQWRVREGDALIAARSTRTSALVALAEHLEAAHG